MSRIAPSQQLAELARQLAEQAREGTEVEDLRLGARKLIQELLEAEVTELLGRGRYERREPGQEGARNGCARACYWGNDIFSGKISMRMICK